MTNRDALILLCSQLSVGQQHKPFSNIKISQLISKLATLGLELKDLSNKTFEELKNLFYGEKVIDEKGQDTISQIISLFSREGSMAFAFMELKKWGIDVLTKFDDDYPKAFIQELGSSAPALFYFAGNKDLLKEKYIGFTGSRLKKTNTEDEEITKAWANESINQGYGIVSGGASGIDSFSTQVAIKLKKPFIEWLSDSLIKRLQINAISLSLQNGNGLLLSEAIPTAPFNVGLAMARNKYIYLTAEKVIAIKAEYSIKDGKKTGGTWNGAIENLNSNYKKILVINNELSKGNQELISKGATPIPLFPDNNFTFKNIKPLLKPQITSDIENEVNLIKVLKDKNFYMNIKLNSKERTLIDNYINWIEKFKSIKEFQQIFPEKLFNKIHKYANEVLDGKRFISTSLI
jgi:predicted Rossmann fold nucleotide-binding protein DprA/Smf involved in DNA uptake